jgi:hypothetical protein
MYPERKLRVATDWTGSTVLSGLCKKGDYEYIEEAVTRHAGKTIQDEHLNNDGYSRF